MEEKRNACRLLVRKPEGKRPLEKPRRTWAENIKLYFVELELVEMDWIGLTQD
jgi:hypothetical protein